MYGGVFACEGACIARLNRKWAAGSPDSRLVASWLRGWMEEVPRSTALVFVPLARTFAGCSFALEPLTHAGDMSS
jgi:hypothetical protein